MPLVSQTFDQLIDFTRTTAATFVGSNGLIQNTPASVNLLTYTQQFDNAVWAKSGVTVTANTTAAPDGTSTADTLTASAGASTHRFIGPAATIAVSNSCTHSIYVKAGSYNFVQIHDGASAIYFANFNLTTGVVGTSANCTATITDVGNGWYRCAMSFTVAAANPVIGVCLVSSASAVRNESWTATGTETVFLWGAQTEANTAASTYTRNNGGVFPPRFDYDPVTLAAKGLLVEEQRTNLATYSEQFDNAAWTKTAATVTANATASPDGTADADLLVPTTTLAQHRLDYTSTSTAATHAFSAYAKSGGYGFVWLRIGTSGGVVSLTDGTVSSVSGGYTVTATNAGGGWWRVVVVGSAALNSIVRINALPTSSAADFAGDGTSGIFIWGAQLEAGSFATSYIPTVASQVTRTGDQTSIVAPNFAPWYNQSEGTFVCDADTADANQANRTIYYASGGTDVVYGVAGTLRTIRVLVNGVQTGAVNAGVFTNNIPAKTAGAYKVNDFAGTFNGTLATSGTGAVPTSINTLTIGAQPGYSAAFYLNGHIRSIRYYPTRLTNAQLQALTA